MPPSAPSKRTRLWMIGLLALLLLAYAAYAGLFIAKTFFPADGKVYSALFDDAMISMTYARNLAEGHGPVWNPGERVEGYTNPLWVVMMAGVHLLPIPENWISLVVQIIGGLFFMGALVFTWRIARRLTGESLLPTFMAVFLTAFYYPLSNWSLYGNEVSVLLLAITAGAWLALRDQDAGRFSPWLYGLMGLSTLVRIDMVVPYLVLWGWLFWFDRAHRRQHLLWGAGLLLLFVGGQSVWRKLYYGDWLPLTYYLKMEGLPLMARLERGWQTFVLFAASLRWYWLPLPFVALALRRERKTLLLMLLLLAQCAYSIYVGGDAWEHRGGANRFVALGMPFFMLLFSIGLWDLVAWARGLLERLLGALAARSTALKRGLVLALCAAAGLGFVLVCLLALLYFNRLKDEGWMRYDLTHLETSNLRFVFLYEPTIYKPGTARYTRDALIIRQVTTPEARVAMVAAGNICYFVHRYCIDILGKSDPVIAHSPIRESLDAGWEALRPGHIKYDYEHSFGTLEPDVIVELRAGTVDEGKAITARLGYEAVKLNGHLMYFKTGSPAVLWDKVYAAAEQ